MSEPLTSVIIINYKTPVSTAECIRSIRETTHRPIEIIVVDNASEDGSVETLKTRFPELTVIASSENLGFARGCNCGAAVARGEYLAFINSDCFAHPQSLDRLIDRLSHHPEISVTIPRMENTAGHVAYNVARLPTVGSIFAEYLLGRGWATYAAIRQKKAFEPESFSGASFVIRKTDFNAVGGFNPDYFMYVEDVELSLMLRDQGKRFYYDPDAVFGHVGGKSSQSDPVLHQQLTHMLHEHRIRYVQKFFPQKQAKWATRFIKWGLALHIR